MLITTRECGLVMSSVASVSATVCVSVCLSYSCSNFWKT